MSLKFILLFLFISFSTFGQTKEIDSIVQLIENTSDFVLKSSYESDLAKLYRSSGLPEKSENFALLSIEHLKSYDEPEILARAYSVLGNLNYDKWKSSIALNYYQKVDSVLTSNKIINESLYSARLNIGNVHIRLIEDNNDKKSYLKVKSYYINALEIAKQIKDSSKIGYAHIRIGHVEKSLKNFNEALENFKTADVYISEKSKYIKDLYYGLGISHLGVGDKKRATFFMRKYFELRKNSGIPQQVAIGHWSFGRHLFNIGEYKESIIHEKKSAELFNSFKTIDYGRLSSVNKITYDSYEKLGDYKNAFIYLLKHKEMNDSAISISRRSSVDKLETKYQAEKKEQEITLLKSQNEIVEQQKRNQRNILLSGIGITSIAGLFLFGLFRNRQKTNTKLKELDTAKSNFFANISHEFRTPLTLISNPIETTLEENNLPDTKRQQFEMAKRNSDRLLSLVNQLLDLSKIDAGHLRLQIQKSNAIQYINALSESFVYTAKQKNINYNLNIKPYTKDVYFDKDALEKIVVNLLSNAIKYTKEKGTILCDAFIENDTLQLKVKNSGKGLSQTEIKNIFHRFYQTNEENNGTGIGLALVKELVELHKGKINVSSRPNEFTIFTVTLPIDKNSFKNDQFVTLQKDTSFLTPNLEQTISIEDEEFIDTDQPILLLVEDNDDVRLLLKQTFEETYNIITASNGEKGIELAIEHIPDLIISDIMMPIKDGIELTERLKNDERTSHIPIILLTAKAGDDNKLTGLEVGADDYITKPFNSKLLITKVEKLIENRRLLQQRYSQELVLYPKDISVTNIDEQFLEKVQTILDDNLLESSFSVTQFSEAAGMSRMQLHRKLKALTGLTTTEFIRSQRLKLAAKLLKTSDINISQVGYSVGFNDHSYFTKCFKDTYKCTPTEYAKRNS